MSIPVQQTGTSPFPDTAHGWPVAKPPSTTPLPTTYLGATALGALGHRRRRAAVCIPHGPRLLPPDPAPPLTSAGRLHQGCTGNRTGAWPELHMTICSQLIFQTGQSSDPTHDSAPHTAVAAQLLGARGEGGKKKEHRKMPENRRYLGHPHCQNK